MSPEDIVHALGALGKQADALMANVLATDLLNRLRHGLALFEHVSEGVVALDEDGVVTYANPGALRILGCAPSDIIGRDFHDTTGHRLRGASTTLPRAECLILQTLGPRRRRVEARGSDVFLRRDGSERLVGYSAAPVVHRGHVIGAAVVFRDITQEKQQEARLALFETALDAVADPVLWVSEDGSLQYANRAACAFFGRPRELLVRLTVFELHPAFTPESWRAHWLRVRGDRCERLRARQRRGDGVEVLTEVSIAHVAQDPDEFHVVSIRPLEDAA